MIRVEELKFENKDEINDWIYDNLVQGDMRYEPIGWEKLSILIHFIYENAIKRATIE